MISSQAAGPASQAGAQLATVSTTENLIERVQEEPPELVVLDLSLPGLNLKEFLPQLKSQGTSSMKIIAFGPHVHEQRLAEAYDAGCDQVLTRGQFHSTMADVFAKVG